MVHAWIRKMAVRTMDPFAIWGMARCTFCDLWMSERMYSFLVQALMPLLSHEALSLLIKSFVWTRGAVLTRVVNPLLSGASCDRLSSMIR